MDVFHKGDLAQRSAAQVIVDISQSWHERVLDWPVPGQQTCRLLFFWAVQFGFYLIDLCLFELQLCL